MLTSDCPECWSSVFLSVADLLWRPAAPLEVNDLMFELQKGASRAGTGSDLRRHKVYSERGRRAAWLEWVVAAGSCGEAGQELYRHVHVRARDSQLHTTTQNAGWDFLLRYLHTQRKKMRTKAPSDMNDDTARLCFWSRRCHLKVCFTPPTLTRLPHQPPPSPALAWSSKQK